MAEPIATIYKNTREQIRIGIEEFKGRRFVDLRLYAASAEGEIVPTRKGIAIKPELLRQVIQALERAEANAQALGLLPPADR